MVSPCWSPQSLSITSNSHNNRGCFFGLKNPQSSCSLSSNKAASGSSLRAVNAVVCSNDVELAEPPALQCSGASGSASIEVAQVKMYSTNRQAVDRNGVMPERKVVPSFGFASFLRCGFELRSCRLHGESMWSRRDIQHSHPPHGSCRDLIPSWLPLSLIGNICYLQPSMWSTQHLIVAEYHWSFRDFKLISTALPKKLEDSHNVIPKESYQQRHLFQCKAAKH